MRSIVVESRKDPRVAPVLDSLADTCQKLGHRVCRWRGPLSGRVPYSRMLPLCDVAIVFNGLHYSYEQSLSRFRALGITPLFVELGWHPQNGTFQIDPGGINALANWSAEPLTNRPRTALKVRAKGDLLLLLQLDTDSQITRLSPWFANMGQWVKHMSEYSRLPLRIRRHPLSQPSEKVVQVVHDYGLRWDHSSSLAESMASCRAVACVNSSGAVEAIAQKLPVLCYGQAVFRQEHAAYCLTNDGSKTAAVTSALVRQECTLAVESVEELIARITGHQWTLYDPPLRLATLLHAAFRRHDAQSGGAALLARLQPVERISSCIDLVRRAAHRFAA